MTVPEWWREFQSLIPSPDECFRDIPVQRMVCQQAMAFRLSATQLEWDGSWTACLGLLEWRDFLPPLDFNVAWDYWVLQAEETVALAKALQRHCPFLDATMGVLWCSAETPWVSHLHDSEWQYAWPWNVGCRWEGPHGPHSEGTTPLPMPRVEPPVSVTTPSEPSISEPEEATLPEELTLVPRQRPPPPLAFPSHGLMSLIPPTRTSELAPGHTPGSSTGFCLLGLHIGNYLTFSRNRWGTLWVPIPGHCPDVPGPSTPTIGLAWTPGPTWLWRAMSKCDGLYLLHEWLDCS